jgi:hypothetical protein
MSYKDLKYGDPIAVIDRTRPLFKVEKICYVVHILGSGVVAHQSNSLYVTWIDHRDIIGKVLDNQC